MQVVGIFLLIMSIWSIWCGIESFNPLFLMLAVLQNSGSAQQIIAEAKAQVAATSGMQGDATAFGGTPGAAATGTSPGNGSTGSTNGGAADASVLATQANSAEAKQAYKNYAQTQLASKYHLTDPSQFASLVKLWNQESGWNPQATNKSSGAFGIVQALPASKIPGGTNANAQAQIDWGLAYL